MLTVKEVRDFIADLPDDAPFLETIGRHYQHVRGIRSVQVTGPETGYFTDYDPWNRGTRLAVVLNTGLADGL